MDLENTQTAKRALDCHAGGILGQELLPSTAGSAVANDDHDPTNAGCLLGTASCPIQCDTLSMVSQLSPKACVVGITPVISVL